MLMKMFTAPCVQVLSGPCVIGKGQYLQGQYWFLLVLWYLKQFLCFLQSNFYSFWLTWATFGLPSAYLPSAIWDLSLFLQDSAVSSSLQSLHIFAHILCCHQRIFFVPPCYSFDFTAELKGEARKSFASQFSYSFSHCIFRSPLCSHHVPP